MVLTCSKKRKKQIATLLLKVATEGVNEVFYLLPAYLIIYSVLIAILLRKNGNLKSKVWEINDFDTMLLPNPMVWILAESLDLPDIMLTRILRLSTYFQYRPKQFPHHGF